MMKEQPKYVVFEKKEKWWQSIVSDLFTYSLAFLLMFSSWMLGQVLWTIVGISIFFMSLIAGACESKAKKLSNKNDAIKWANSLEDEK